MRFVFKISISWYYFLITKRLWCRPILDAKRSELEMTADDVQFSSIVIVCDITVSRILNALSAWTDLFLIWLINRNGDLLKRLRWFGSLTFVIWFYLANHLYAVYASFCIILYFIYQIRRVSRWHCALYKFTYLLTYFEYIKHITTLTP